MVCWLRFGKLDRIGHQHPYSGLTNRPRKQNKNMKSSISKRHIILTALAMLVGITTVVAAVCATCQGAGTSNTKCFVCKGSGSQGSFKCSHCNGKGFSKCSSCGGTGQKR